MNATPHMSGTAPAPISEADAARPGSITGTFVRIGVSVALLALIAQKVDVPTIGRTIVRMDSAWLLATVMAVYAAIVLSAVKWDVLLRARGHRIGMPRLLRHYMVGLYFNNFLPTSVGGDVVRAWDIGRDVRDSAEGAASVVAERLIASVGLALTATFALLFARVGTQAMIAVAAVFVFGVGLTALIAVPSVAERLVGSAVGGRFANVAGWLARATGATGSLLRARGAAATVLAMSIGFQVLVALVNYCLFRAIGVTVTFAECVVYTSIVSAVTMVPVSISGLGIREAGYAYFFGLAGVAATSAVTASMLFFVTVAVCTLPGAVFFATGKAART